MKLAKTTIAAILILTVGLLLLVSSWGEGVEPASSSVGPAELSSTPSDEMSVGLGGEDEGAPSTDLERRAVPDTAPPSWRLEGHVRDQGGRPLAGVKILCEGLSASAAVTNEDEI